LPRSRSLLILAALLVAGCWIVTDYKSYTLDVPETRTWPATGIVDFSVKTENGEVAVAATQTDTDDISAVLTRSCTGADSAEAAAHIDDITVTEEVTGTAVTLDADMPNSTVRNYGAHFDVTMPAGIAVDLETRNGPIAVTGTMSEVKVKTTNGGIDTDGSRGELALESSNGPIAVTDHIGSADVKTSNGGVDCSLTLAEATQSADLETSNGPVTLELPSDAEVTFDASTTNGKVTVEGFTSVDYTTNKNTRKAGTIGGGGATVDITTTNGNVTIKAQ
jgi:DUF4097 and DUF4098 domain-containing protein YvlB